MFKHTEDRFIPPLKSSAAGRLLPLNLSKYSLGLPPFGFRPFRRYALESSIGVETMPTEYSLSDVLERLYQNQLALEAAGWN